MARVLVKFEIERENAEVSLLLQEKLIVILHLEVDSAV